MRVPALFRRRPADPVPEIRRLVADLAEQHTQNIELAARLRSETTRADVAERAHRELVDDVRVLRRQVELLRRDRDGALSQLDAALGYDAKTLETINAGAAKTSAAA